MFQLWRAARYILARTGMAPIEAVHDRPFNIRYEERVSEPKVVIDVLLDHSVAHNGERNDGAYPAFDHLGRPVRHAWVDGNLDEHGSLSTVPNIPPIVELTFAFDRNSNMTNKLDGRPGSKWTNRDARYTYDLLDRLEEAERGNLVSTTWTDAARSQKWTFDPIGNWQKMWTDIDGDGSYEDATAAKELDDRDHNDVNELVERILKGQGASTTDITLDMTFDRVGNMLSQEVVNRLGGATTITYTYDAWNRLVLVEYDTGSGANPREAYSYDGLHQRITVISDSETTPNGTLDQQRDLYYDAAWRLVEDRVDGKYISEPGMDSYTQYFWGMRGSDDVRCSRCPPCRTSSLSSARSNLSVINCAAQVRMIGPTCIAVDRGARRLQRGLQRTRITADRSCSLAWRAACRSICKWATHTSSPKSAASPANPSHQHSTSRRKTFRGRGRG